ncbi:hypothetical protein [Limnofasciculus baicalensis]|uniref:Uncharacterized protein n=1 Tax=Limnofasciculus baicalensis BBK-W-15 TaxID=2699891 RepID=A0AAE3KP97_9CYAN|nr:hypothetical protein [Limnofasciculus baicalensis]MCP2730681.1 hypothetical protein [Limnofasciculus baicalensis BBK-W-15]
MTVQPREIQRYMTRDRNASQGLVIIDFISTVIALRTGVFTHLDMDG